MYRKQSGARAHLSRRHRLREILVSILKGASPMDVFESLMSIQDSGEAWTFRDSCSAMADRSKRWTVFQSKQQRVTGLIHQYVFARRILNLKIEYYPSGQRVGVQPHLRRGGRWKDFTGVMHYGNAYTWSEYEIEGSESEVLRSLAFERQKAFRHSAKRKSIWKE